MRMQRWGLSLVLCLGLAAIGCGDDDSSTGNGSTGGGAGKVGGSSGKTGGSSGSSSGSSGSGSGSGDMSAADVAAGGCGMMGSSSSSQCKGLTEYSTCIENACSAQYKTCLGAGYKSGDFSGGKCATYFKCVSGSKDKCNNTCMIDATCMDCFVSELGMCEGNADCTLPDCGGAGDAGAGTGTTTTGKTCDDLLDCCNNMLPAMYKSTCTMAYDAVKGSGNVACNAAYSAFTSLGCK